MKPISLEQEVKRYLTAKEVEFEQIDATLFTTLACYGDYVDEEVTSGGITRKPPHWDKDVQSTR